MRVPCWELTGHGKKEALIMGSRKWSYSVVNMINVGCAC